MQPPAAAIAVSIAGRELQPLKEIWPDEPDSLLSWEAGFSSEEMVLRIKYRMEKPLDAAAEPILAKVMQARLQVDRLRLVLEKEAPPRAAEGRGNKRSYPRRRARSFQRL